MYHATVMRSEEDDEGENHHHHNNNQHARRDRLNNGSTGASSHSTTSNNNHARSPTQQPQSDQPYPYSSPSKASPSSRSHFATNSYRPSSSSTAAVASSSHIPPPPTSPRPLSTTATAYQQGEYPPPRDRPKSNYYDPTSDSGERKSNTWSDAPVAVPAPPPPVQPRDTFQHSTTVEAPKFYNGAYTSPVTANFPPISPISHSHPQPQLSTAAAPRALSPGMAPLTSPHARTNGNAAYHNQETLAASSPPSRATNPMSFSSILADDTPAQQTPAPAAKVSKPPRKSKTPCADSLEPAKDDSFPALTPAPAAARVPSKRKVNGETKKPVTKLKITTKFDEKEIEDILANMERDASPIDSEEFKHEHITYQLKSIQRRLELDKEEMAKNKRRRTEFSEYGSKKLGRHAARGEERYRAINKFEAVSAVQEKEIQAEKERKKDMQRKRRREKTLQNNVENKESALAKAEAASDEAEREKFLREAQRAEKKAQQTQRILAGGHKSGTDIQASSPIEPNFNGGVSLTFTAADSDTPKNAKRVNNRPRKSKAQKQAEKDRAEASQAAIDAGEELPPLPPAKHEQKLKLKLNTKETTEIRDEDSPAPAGERFASKGYNQIYEQIWRDLARKDVNKVHRLKLESTETRKSNLKKTAILASKEAKRWQARTNKGTKDLQARAKRVMREMMSFWKRNEREERDLRRAAERQEVENAKKAEADREANRQKRKLNFLISQTELYSHFIGKKIKTDEVERSTDHPDTVTASAGQESSHKVPNVDLGKGAAPAKVTNFEDLDFDAEDDSVLQAAAAANAQNAIQEAQDKARAFNKQDDTSAMNDQGEMNFQNPAGMGDVDIEQPKMLQAQLKEYQLKGLNWMVNLYEQGINGILADEMGLGKTVQSISVMAYLAEKHGIWGPFMVVAPASTLHNWQQEIAKFVPTLKVLPYWGTQADRKVLRKFWDRRHIAYTQDADFHVLITSYQVIVQDVGYFQKMWWQYMILDEAQAIKSSQSSRWKALLGLHCRNRLLLTGTPIQNNMQELWALLHFIMPTLFDSHEEFSEWFSKDIESHTQSNTKLNQDQLKRLHMILKPFMLRRVKAHVQKELGDKIEIDLFCDLTYRQRAYYSNLRNQISIMDLIEKATSKDDSDTGTLMNLVMQFRKVCNHPDLFERAITTSPFSFGSYAETASFMREGPLIHVGYSTRNEIQYNLPRLLWREGGRLDLPGQDNEKAGFKGKYLDGLLNVWNKQNIHEHAKDNDAFSFLRFSDVSVDEVSGAFRQDVFSRAVKLAQKPCDLGALSVVYDEVGEENFTPAQAMFRITDRKNRRPLAEVTNEGYLNKLMNVSKDVWTASGHARLEQCGRPAATAPPIEVVCLSRGAVIERDRTFFNVPVRRALYGPTPVEEKALLTSKVPAQFWPPTKMLPAPTSDRQRFTHIKVPSMRRFVTDSGKLAKLDSLLAELKEGGHRVLLYFQMTRMIDLMEEYLTYRNYKYCRLDGSTKLEDRRDTVADFQTRPEIFIFLLSTRAGGLGINLTSADTVIFYDSDWNPTIDSQAMDRAHRLGQTRQVTVYRMITRNTIEERIRRRAMQKEEVQKVVMTGGSGGGVDFNTRSKENKAKDIAMWLVDDEEAAEIDRREKEIAEQEAREGPEAAAKKGKGGKSGKKRKLEAAGGGGGGSLEDLYHEGEGHFDDGSNRPSGTATPIGGDADDGPKSKKSKKSGGGGAKKAKSAKQRLAMVDGGDID